MRTTAAIALLVLGPTLAGCSANTTLETTPTFQAARKLPPPTAAVQLAREPYSPTRAPKSARNGGTWIIRNMAPGKMYELPTRTGMVSYIKLPPGISINDGAIGGDVNGFNVVGTHVGQRATLAVMANYAGRRTNIAIPTTNDELYHFLVTSSAKGPWILEVEVNHAAPMKPIAFGLAPAGDYQRLTLVPGEDGAMPAWAPVEVWADARKMVARFAAPLPTMPALYAGGRGEQTVNYSVEHVPGYVILSTDRRVTEAEFRLGREVIRITADAGGRQWRQAGTLESKPDLSLASGPSFRFGEPKPFAVGTTLPPLDPPHVMEADKPESEPPAQPTI